MLPQINAFLKENIFAIFSFTGLILINIINQLGMGETGLYFWKNLLWQVVGLVLFTLVWLKFDYRRVSLELVWLIYSLLLFLLLLLALLKKRWLVIGPISFQPSEFLKVVLLFLISLYAAKKQQISLDYKEVLFLLIIISLPLLLILPVDLDYAGIIF